MFVLQIFANLRMRIPAPGRAIKIRIALLCAQVISHNTENGIVRTADGRALSGFLPRCSKVDPIVKTLNTLNFRKRLL